MLGDNYQSRCVLIPMSDFLNFGEKLKSKITLPEINKDNFPYKFYLAYWIDTNSTSTWENLEHIKN